MEPPRSPEVGEQLPVQVLVRLRPLAGHHQSIVVHAGPRSLKICNPIQTTTASGEAVLVSKRLEYTFDWVLQESSSQEDTFRKSSSSMLRHFLQGGNALLFSYGPSGSGKTYTIQGDQKNPGILPNVLKSIFSSIDAANSGKSNTDKKSTDGFNIPLPEGMEYNVWVSYLECYNEKLFDLLKKKDKNDKSGNPPVEIKYTKNYVPVVSAHEPHITGIQQALQWLQIGSENRQVGATNINKSSSRSHAIFTIKLAQTPIGTTPEQIKKDPSIVRYSKFCIVDLAGSERGSKSQASGDRLKEASNINNSLLTLKRCMKILQQNQLVERGLVPPTPGFESVQDKRMSTDKRLSSDPSKRLSTDPSKSKPQVEVVPFRESTLTKLLREFFQGEGKCSVIVNVNPSPAEYEETLQALDFGTITKAVKTTTCKKKMVARSQSPPQPIPFSLTQTRSSNIKSKPSGLNLSQSLNQSNFSLNLSLNQSLNPVNTSKSKHVDFADSSPSRNRLNTSTAPSPRLLSTSHFENSKSDQNLVKALFRDEQAQPNQSFSQVEELSEMSNGDELIEENDQLRAQLAEAEYKMTQLEMEIRAEAANEMALRISSIEKIYKHHADMMIEHTEKKYQTLLSHYRTQFESEKLEIENQLLDEQTVDYEMQQEKEEELYKSILEKETALETLGMELTATKQSLNRLRSELESYKENSMLEMQKLKNAHREETAILQDDLEQLRAERDSLKQMLENMESSAPKSEKSPSLNASIDSACNEQDSSKSKRVKTKKSISNSEDSSASSTRGKKRKAEHPVPAAGSKRVKKHVESVPSSPDEKARGYLDSQSDIDDLSTKSSSFVSLPVEVMSPEVSTKKRRHMSQQSSKSQTKKSDDEIVCSDSTSSIALPEVTKTRKSTRAQKGKSQPVQSSAQSESIDCDTKRESKFTRARPTSTIILDSDDEMESTNQSTEVQGPRTPLAPAPLLSLKGRTLASPSSPKLVVDTINKKSISIDPENDGENVEAPSRPVSKSSKSKASQEPDMGAFSFNLVDSAAALPTRTPMTKRLRSRRPQEVVEALEAPTGVEKASKAVGKPKRRAAQPPPFLAGSLLS